MELASNTPSMVLKLISGLDHRTGFVCLAVGLPGGLDRSPSPQTRLTDGALGPMEGQVQDNTLTTWVCGDHEKIRYNTGTGTKVTDFLNF